MAKIDAVIFDLDDTLYDEIDYIKSGFSVVAAKLSQIDAVPHKGQIFEALWNEFLSGDRTRVFNNTLEKLNLTSQKDDPEFISGLVQAYRRHTPDISLPQDSRDLLEKLRGSYKLGLLTDGYMPAQQLKVRALGIEQYFQAIVYTELLGRGHWKPATTGFEKLAEELRTIPKRMTYIADNEKKDFRGPNKLGFITIQVLRENRIHTEISNESDTKATYTITSLAKIPELLSNIET